MTKAIELDLNDEGLNADACILSVIDDLMSAGTIQKMLLFKKSIYSHQSLL